MLNEIKLPDEVSIGALIALVVALGKIWSDHRKTSTDQFEKAHAQKDSIITELARELSSLRADVTSDRRAMDVLRMEMLALKEEVLLLRVDKLHLERQVRLYQEKLVEVEEERDRLRAELAEFEDCASYQGGICPPTT